MPITQITIENFKGIGSRIEIPIRPITLLFGANSAGKSTIFQALLYLRELLERDNADADKLFAGGVAIDLGGFNQFVHRHDFQRKVIIGISLSVDDDELPIYSIPFPEGGSEIVPNWMEEPQLTGVDEVSVDVTVGLNSGEERPSIESYQVAVNGQMIGKISQSGFGASLSDFDCNHPIFSKQLDLELIDDEEENPLSGLLSGVLNDFTLQPPSIPEERAINVGVGANVIPKWGHALNLAAAKGTIAVDEEHNVYCTEFIISQIMVGAGELALKELKDSRYLGPIRSVPPRNFIGQRTPEKERWADGTAAWDLLFQDAIKDDGLIRKVSNCLSESKLLNLGYRITGESIYPLPTDSLTVNILRRLAAESEDADIEAELQRALSELLSITVETRLTITDIEKETAVNAADIGSGVSQVIPVLVSLLDRASSITAIEQPELHIHLAVQCGLGDVFVREALKTDERVFLVETHSEHLLLRIMKRLRQTYEDTVEDPELTVSPEHVSVLFVETYEGRSIYREMPLNERGELIKAWPGGFFEEDLDEMI